MKKEENKKKASSSPLPKSCISFSYNCVWQSWNNLWIWHPRSDMGDTSLWLHIPDSWLFCSTNNGFDCL